MTETLRALRLWLSTAARAAPLLVGVQCLFAVAQAVTAPLQTYGVKLLVDGLTRNLPGTIGTGIAVILAGFAVTFAAGLVGGPVRDTTGEKVFIRLYQEVLDTTASVPGINHHENPAIANRIEYIRENAWKLGVSFEILLFMFATAANTVAVLTLLGSVHPGLLLLPLLGSARIWAAFQSTRWRSAAAEATMPQARLVDRLIDIVGDQRHGLELRVFGLRDALVQRLVAAQDLRSRTERRAIVRGTRLDGSVRVGFGLAYAAAILWTISAARGGQLSAGDVALVILVAPQVDRMAGAVAGNVYQLGDIVRTFARYDWLRRYARRMSWSEGTEPAPPRLRTGIELRSVDFSYPGSEDGERDGAGSTPGRPVLTGISLAFPAGSTVALVGENGAGKTTLVKLLARMYDPTAGAVLVDGVDLRTFDVSSWRRRISAGFQDFVKFEFLARETVGIGDLDRLDEDAAVARALERADAGPVVGGLPERLRTQLGKRFAGGRDLSGGQWQRLALARAFMRDRPLVLLLDEPTAALDPEAEHALFERFAAASRAAAADTGGITVLVSHRFSTVRMADLIVVLEHGRVLEIGTHQELAAAGGRYAELFALQARAYR